MFDIKGIFEKIRAFVVKVMNKIISKFSGDGSTDAIKKEADEYIESEKQTTSIANTVREKVTKVVSGCFRFLRTNKIARTVVEIVSTCAAIFFIGLVIYIGIKILPKVIVMMATAFAIATICELIICMIKGTRFYSRIEAV